MLEIRWRSEGGGGSGIDGAAQRGCHGFDGITTGACQLGSRGLELPVFSYYRDIQ